jgi:protocatechuate 3,4-dioxygenase beta subunit
MRRGIPVSGTVTDAEGKPLKEALVVWGDDPYFQEGKQETYTDSRGVYRFPPLKPGPTTLTVVAEGWAPELKKVEIAGDSATVDFQLQRGATIKFAFVDRDGKPIPEVYVSIAGWRDAKSLYNHKHPNVLESKIPRQADKNGIYEWSWAPKDHVAYQFGKEGLPYLEPRKFYADDAEHVITLP